jgi:hypothetical protein
MTRKSSSADYLIPPRADIPDHLVHEFMALYKEKFGEDISETDARIRFQQLLTLYAIIGRKPPPPAAS